MSGDTKTLVETAVRRFQEDVPALAKLKLVFGLELRGRKDVQPFRVEVPGPKVTKGFSDDERVVVQIDRAEFNELAVKGDTKAYRKSFETGHIKVEGDASVQKLIAQVIDRHDERARLRKVH